MKNNTVSTLLLAICMAAFHAPAVLNAGDGRSSKPVAVVNGESITESELNIQGKLMELQHQAYELRRSATEKAVSQRVLEKAAAGKGLSVEEYLKQEVDSKIPEPSPAEVEAFYLGQQSKRKPPLEAVRGELAEKLHATRVSAARAAHIESLREQSDVAVLVEPVRFPVEAGDAPRRGPATAPVTIVEFSDYQCPYCKKAQNTIRQVLERYGDDVSLVSKDLPLVRIHAQAQRAAEAARCAGEQGQFWPYHEALYDAGRLTEASFPELAASLGLDEKSFAGCFESRRYEADVQADLEEARRIGASSTPTFFVNGILVKGAQSLETFTRLIDSELERTGGSN